MKAIFLLILILFSTSVYLDQQVRFLRQVPTWSWIDIQHYIRTSPQPIYIQTTLSYQHASMRINNICSYKPHQFIIEAVSQSSLCNQVVIGSWFWDTHWQTVQFIPDYIFDSDVTKQNWIAERARWSWLLYLLGLWLLFTNVFAFF